MSDTTITKQFELDAPINLAVRIGRGSLHVRMSDSAEDAGKASVVLSPNPGAEGVAGEYSVVLNGRTLTVNAPREGGLADLVAAWRQRSRGGVAVTVTVPAGTSTKIVSFNAPVTIAGRCGGADVATGSADITVDEVDGDLLLRYGRATCTVERVAGSLTIRGGAGTTRVGTVGGDLQFGCGNGELEVEAVRGVVRSRTGSGTAMLGAVYSNVDLASGSGSITIGLPTGVSAHLNVNTGSGRVVSDLPIDDRPATGKPTITVRARTGSGDVRLVRSAA